MPTIRPAREDDFPAARRLFQALMGENFELDRGLFAAVCASDGYLVLVAEDGGDEAGPVGIAVVVVNDRIRLAANARRRRYHIDQLVVLPERRQRGVAKALLAHIAREAAAHAPSYVIVNCDFTRVEARRTYESAGFHLVRQNHDRFEIAFP
jgi:ribosomal protein S18 acetylase RimI-like enzyme